MTSPLGSGRRCHLARAAAALASSLDFLQGTSEKIHLQGLLCQKLLQAMDFLAVSRCVRAGPRRFLSWFNHLQLSAPLVEAPRSYPEFSCQLTDIFASLHAFDSPLLKFPGVSLSLHCGSFPGNCALFLCVSSRVHSTFDFTFRANALSVWCLQCFTLFPRTPFLDTFPIADHPGSHCALERKCRVRPL